MICGLRGRTTGSVEIRDADRQQAAGGDEQNFEADYLRPHVRPHGDAMCERPHGGFERALAGFWVAWGLTATCFRRQQQHFTKFLCGRILKVKIWLKMRGKRHHSVRKARVRDTARARSAAGKSARGDAPSDIVGRAEAYRGSQDRQHNPARLRFHNLAFMTSLS